MDDISNQGGQGSIPSPPSSLPSSPVNTPLIHGGKVATEHLSPTTITSLGRDTPFPHCMVQVPAPTRPPSALFPPSFLQSFVTGVTHVATQFQNLVLESPNEVNYSQELVDISSGAEDPVPKTGEIHAGSVLRAELAETAMDIMLSSFQQKGPTAGFSELKKI